MATITSYSPAVLLHLRSVASGRHVVAKQTAELIKAYGLRRPRRRRGCRAGRRAKPRPQAATYALDQSANCLAAAVSQPSSSTTATTTTTITSDDSAQSSVNNQLIANQSVNTGHDSLQELYQPIDNQLSHSSYESSHRIPTIISDRRCRNQLSSTCSFRPKHRDNCLVRIPLEDSRLPSVLLTNVCHLQNKLDDLSVLSKQYYPEIICITESWLSCNIPNIAVNLDGYHLIRKDRSSGPGGGVAVYISNNITCCELSIENVDNFEVLWSIVRPKQLPRPLSCLIIAVVYCPPNYDASTMKKTVIFYYFLL